MKWRGTTALVTGASAGIGRELARVFAQHGYDLVVVARSEDKLLDLANELSETFGVEVTIIVADLSMREAPQELFDTIEEEGLEIDVLVNNAGIAIAEPFEETELDRHLELIQLNVVSLTALTRLFLPSMIVRESGRILNVASIVGFMPSPAFSLYGASKAFVLSLSEGLCAELQGTGVRVTALCPGFTRTEMVSGATQAAGIDSFEKYMPGFILRDPARVAAEGYGACIKGKPVHVDSVLYRALTEAVRFQPRWVVRRMGGVMARFMH